MQNPIQKIEDEEYYKLVAHNINDLVALYSPAGILEYISPSISNVLGYSAESLTGTNPAPIVHPDDQHLLIIDAEAFRKNKERTLFFEYRLLHSDGRWLYFESYRKPIYNAAGVLTNVLAVCRDISVKKKTELALFESEELYRRLAENILDLVVIYKPDGTRMYVSPSSYSFFGYTPEELLGNHFSELVHPDDIDKIRVDIEEKALTGQDKFSIELRTRHKNGQWIYCESTTKVVRDSEGKIAAYVSTTRNISQWKVAQIALKESEEKYKSLVESSDAMIAMVNRQGEFIFVNDKRADFFRQEKAAMIGKTADDFFEAEKAAVFNERVQKVFTEKNKFSYESLAICHGKEYWFKSTLIPVFDATGDVYAVTVSTIDISNLKHSEDSLRKQNDVLKQIAFLQSHIVRSPLTNIQGILLLLDEGGMSEENLAYFRLLKQAAGKLDDVIKEIVEKAIFIKRQTTDEQ